MSAKESNTKEGKGHPVLDMSLNQLVQLFDAGLKLWPYFLGVGFLLGIALFYVAPRSLVNELKCIQDARAARTEIEATLLVHSREAIDSYKQEASFLRMKGMLGKLERELSLQQKPVDLSAIEAEIELMLKELKGERKDIERLKKEADDKVKGVKQAVEVCRDSAP